MRTLVSNLDILAVHKLFVVCTLCLHYKKLVNIPLYYTETCFFNFKFELKMLITSKKLAAVP